MIGLLSPTKGLTTRLPQARIGYLSQSHVEEISKQPDYLTTLAYIQQKLPNEQEDVLRRHFGSFGIGSQMNQSVKSLSGGEAVRVATGICTWTQPYLLILDEPSNHLDIDTSLAVQDAINGFPGSVIVVSHDQSFIENVTKEVYLVNDSSVKLLEGGIAEYVKNVRKRM
jgi:ATP-binding cassette, subfamily F, member 3